MSATSLLNQKIAEPKDIASNSAVSFSINHIAAVVIPASFGVIWLIDNSLVFYAGALIAVASLFASQFINLTKNTADFSQELEVKNK